jgi:hypothetical protein
MLEVGLIESFDAPADHYVLRRGDEQTMVPIQPGGRLMKGDRIEVKLEGDRLTIWLFEPRAAKKSVVVLSRSNGTYLVDAKAPKRGLSQQLSAVWQWAANELGVRDVESREKATAEASIRDLRAFSVPLLNNNQMLAAGYRAIAIGWPRNDGPVRMAIKGPARKVIATGRSSSDRWISRPVDLEPGPYTITIEAASGSVIEKKFEVVPASFLPKFPDDPMAGELPPEHVETIRAAWLAAQRGGRYALEGFQIVAPIAERYHPAKLLSGALIEGSLPTKPP